jgi:N-acetylneuraminic acid mutarotase
MIATDILPQVKASEKQENNTWATLAPMPTARGSLGIVVVYGKIYAIGGTDGNNVFNINEEYNPRTNEWTTKTPMPTARSGFAIVVYQNKIYCIGGSNTQNNFFANNEVYDPLTDSWETKASMPTPRADLTASLVDDKMYLAGGKKYSSSALHFTQSDVNEVYDPITDTWTRKSPMPTAVQGYASAVIGESIYFVGGSIPSVPGSNIFINANQVYDTVTDKWTSSSKAISSTISYGSATATMGFMASTNLYYIGGFTSDGFTNKMQVYNPQNDSWTDGVPMVNARAYLGVTSLNDEIYAIGGFDGQNWLNVNEHFLPVDYGKIPAVVQINSPQNKTYNKVHISYTVNREVTWVGYSLDNKENVTLTGALDLTSLTQGSHEIILYANDSLGNIGQSNTVYFNFDSLSPKVTMLLPQNQSYSSSDIQLTFTIDEKAALLSYSLDGEKTVPILGNLTLPAIPDGSHRIVIYATDELGNSGASETIYFTIATFPLLLVVSIITVAIILLASGYLLKTKKPKKETVPKKVSQVADVNS